MTTPKTTAKRVRLQTFLLPAVHQNVIDLSEQEDRNESQMASILIQEALQARGITHDSQPKAANA